VCSSHSSIRRFRHLDLETEATEVDQSILLHVAAGLDAIASSQDRAQGAVNRKERTLVAARWVLVAGALAAAGGRSRSGLGWPSALLHLGEGGAHSHGSAGEDGEEGGGLHVDGWESEGFEGWKFGMVGDVV